MWMMYNVYKHPKAKMFYWSFPTKEHMLFEWYVPVSCAPFPPAPVPHPVQQRGRTALGVQHQALSQAPYWCQVWFPESTFSADFLMMSAPPLCAITCHCRHLYAHYQFQTHTNTALTGRNGEHCCSPTLLRRTSCREQGKCHKKTGHQYKIEKGRKKCFVVLSYFAEVRLPWSLPS